MFYNCKDVEKCIQTKKQKTCFKDCPYFKIDEDDSSKRRELETYECESVLNNIYEFLGE